MKKAIAILLVAVVAVASAFAGFSIDTRIVGVSAAYGVSYDYNNIEVGFETVSISPVYFGVALIANGSGMSFDAALTEGLYFCYVPEAFNIYAEYDFLNADHFDLSAGLGLVYLTPCGIVADLGGSETEISSFQPTLNVEFAYNFNANHAVTARVVFPFLFTGTSSSESQYFGLEGMAMCSSIGYRYTF